MAQKISNLAVGSKIKITGSKYAGTSSGNPYAMIVAAKNHPGYSGGVVLITEFAAKYCAFDAKEPTNPDANIQAYGNARYGHSNLLQWLNSDASPWYSAKHEYDREPADVYVSKNPYSTQKGFMSHFPAEFNSLLLDIPAVTIVAGSGGRETITSKWAIPSVTELYGTSELTDKPEGTQFAYFTSNERRKCTLNTGEVIPSLYYTRTPKILGGGNSVSTHELVTVTANTGEKSSTQPYSGEAFVRPFCLISNDALVTDSEVDGYYSLIYNAVPTKPMTISIPGVINSGADVEISWSAGADSDGNLAGYILERSVNSTTWTEVYRGALRSYTDAAKVEWEDVAYRVKAYDTHGASSEYLYSEKRTVTHNTAPTISGADGNLGTFSTAFTAQSYTVNDAEGGTVTVVERLDGVARRTYSAKLGTADSYSFTASEWRRILNGQHTLTITATDSNGLSTVRTWTFTKAMNTLTFTITPLPADAMPDRCVVDAVGNFPEGSTLKIEVCNNANDTSPRWEDVSDKLRSKHFFANRSKTAAAWAFGLRCTITRGTAAGPVWLDYITINYR